LLKIPTITNTITHGADILGSHKRYREPSRQNKRWSFHRTFPLSYEEFNISNYNKKKAVIKDDGYG
jgi:hypothetical protein